jgi:uncharacterized protein
MLLLKHPTLCLPAEHSLRIETGAIMAFPVRQGQLLTIVDERGGQPAALFGVDAADSRHFVSPHHTRVFSNSFILRLGMRVVTNRRRPAMVLGRDTVGAHDLLMPVTEAGDGADCEGASERFKDKVRAALARQRVDVVRVPDPINLFLDVAVGTDGSLTPKGVVSSAKSSVTFRVVMDLIVAVAAPLPDEKLWRGSASGALAVHVHNRPDASFE